MSKTAPIAIVGGGPCGLTFARLLERAGMEYIVFERDSPDPKPNHQGGTLDLHTGTGLAAIDTAGLREEFEKYARYEAAVFTVQDAQGGNFFRADAGATGDEQRPEIDRLQLRKILLDSVPRDRICWGKTLKAVVRDEKAGEESGGAQGWVLRFADGTEESGFRMVIGADGASSAVRPLVGLLCSKFRLPFVSLFNSLTPHPWSEHSY